jgi:hypothetical protein
MFPSFIRERAVFAAYIIPAVAVGVYVRGAAYTHGIKIINQKKIVVKRLVFNINEIYFLKRILFLYLLFIFLLLF